MFQMAQQKRKSGLVFGMAELIYHSVVRNIRKGHRNALIAILQEMMQAILFVVAFYVMFSVLGLRGSALRGNFILFIMSGIFLFLTHTKALSAVVGSEGPTSAMMKHAPMNTMIAISAAALSSLYVQVLSMVTIFFIYHVVVEPIEIENPAGAFGMFLLAWFSGVSIGMVFLALKPWFPGFVKILTSIYSRANMIASGKMFVANTMPGFLLAMFDWNPLFHCIDQTRDFAFINYSTNVSNWVYPIVVSVVLIMVGLMGEFYTRKNASASWFQGR